MSFTQTTYAEAVKIAHDNPWSKLEVSITDEGIKRIKHFCKEHSKSDIDIDHLCNQAELSAPDLVFGYNATLLIDKSDWELVGLPLTASDFDWYIVN